MADSVRGFHLWSLVKGFFKLLFWVGLFLQTLIMLVVLLLFVGVFTSISDQMAGHKANGPSAHVPKGAALVINPEGLLVEQAAPTDNFSAALSNTYGAGRSENVEVHEIVRAIRAAKTDERIKMLVLNLDGLHVPATSLSKALYIGDTIEDFKQSGKQVVAIGDQYSQEQYLIAAHADKIMLHDYGHVILYGYGAYRTYFNALLEKLNVTNHVFRVGSFKSALEPFMRDDMSPEAKQANQEYLSHLWSVYVTRIEEKRKLDAGAIAGFANNLDTLLEAEGGDLAKVAVTAGLVDKLASRAEQLAYIKEIVGKSKNDESFKRVGMRTYLLDQPSVSDGDAPNIAVVTAAGPILDGEQPIGYAGGDTIAQHLEQVLHDEAVKGVVLRVDSPGGSAFASEIIRDRILELKQAGKPVVVSMGSLAASGGYWISANADQIWATPTTLTGSIGIFGFLMTYENTVAEIGVSTDGVGTTDLSAILAAGIGPLPEKFSRILQSSTEQGYERFLDIVSTGRAFDKTYADSVAQGRVWIGAKAQKLNLVDRLGSIDEAIEAAAVLAGVQDSYDVIQIEEKTTPFEQFLENLAGVAVSYGFWTFEDGISFGEDKTFLSKKVGIAQMLQAAQRELVFYESFNDPNALYARCLDCELH